MAKEVANQKARQASPECICPIRGLENQTSYPRVQQENILNKMDCRTLERERGEENKGHGEHEVIRSEQEA